MSTQQDYAAAHYAPRAGAYVTSAVHASGPDLDQIEALVTGHGGATVLDLGCGGGHVSLRAAPHVARVVACDVTQAMLDEVAKRGIPNIETRRAAAESLPFADGEFDFVLCRFSAHHWQNLDAGLRAARRVLKPSGQAVFIDTIAPAARVLDTHLQAMELLRDPSHVRNYSVAEWVSSLSRAGFSVQGTIVRRLRMEFPSWTARTATPPATAEAILRLQRGAPDEVKTHFAIADDGSFDLESATFVLG